MPTSKLKYLLSSVAACAAIGLAAHAVAAPDGQANAKAKATNKIYIVQMADAPVTAYAGGVAGYAATKPARGQKIDPQDAKVDRYVRYLASRQDALLAGVGGAKKVHSYGYVFSGFSAELTEAQASKLSQTAGVLAVTKDEARALDTATTPAFLGLSGSSGFWASKAKGENVIIGIVDGGIWPEHPSFSDRTGANGNGSQDGKLDYQQIPGWHGKCTPGEQFNASNCNQKLIGARYYNGGWGGNAGIDAQLPWEFNSPRDFGGHGTHTASTAGGNAGVPTTGPAAVLGSVSGIAPRARIAAYKVCWETGTGGSCFPSDSVAAIDQAVADGVDVINFSISGSRTNFRDPVEIAFLFAADAGVFVAASAGNSGPTTSTVAHPGPWLTTVAAGTHNRDGAGSVTLGSSTTYAGASLATLGSVGPLDFIDAQSAGLPGADPTAVRLCFAAVDNGGVAVLDPAKIAGKIVLCDRGVTARVNKSLAVQQAGGKGMVLVNTSVASLNADLHAVPSVHVQYSAADYAALHAYANTAGAKATINLAAVVLTAPAPFTAGFSSRGPLQASGSLLKPDLIAPGQDVLAGVAPPGNGGKLFDLYSGTSMSSPHVAGLAALMKELKPGWSPMAIKSALMTTGSDILDGPNTNPLVIFRQGAGHVQPNSAADPGLVFDSGFADWLGFLCGTQLPTSFCTSAGVPVLDPSDFNGASIAVGALAGAKTVTRRVTNVSGNPATYTASVAGMAGFTVAMSPASLVVGAGETKSFTITITRTTAPLNAYTGGQLTLSDGIHNVRLPMVVRPVALAAPTQVSGSFDVTFGYTGSFTATARGLSPATVTGGNVTQDPDQTFVQGDPTGTVAIPITIPAGSTYARFALFDADVTPGSDLDVFVYQGSVLVGSSTAGGSTEEVNFSFAAPTAGPTSLTVYVHGWGVAGGTSPFKLHEFYVGSTAAGNMTLTAPGSATLGATGTIGITTTGLAAGTKYIGSVVFGGTAGMPAPTIVRIDTP